MKSILKNPILEVLREIVHFVKIKPLHKTGEHRSSAYTQKDLGFMCELRNIIN